MVEGEARPYRRKQIVAEEAQIKPEDDDRRTDAEGMSVAPPI